MKIYIKMLLALWLVWGCTEVDNVLEEKMDIRKIALSVEVEKPITINTRLSEKEKSHYFIFDEKGNLVEYIAGENGDTYVTLNKGCIYKCYAVMAHADEDVKQFRLANTEKKMKELAFTVGSSDVEKQGLVMTGSKEIGIDEEDIKIKVGRIYAKIEIVFNTDELPLVYNYKLVGVKAYNVPKKTYYFETESYSSAVEFFADPIELDMTGAEYVLYMLENSAGERVEIDGDSGDWSNQKEKKTYAPENATYVCVEGEISKDGQKYKTNHWIYLGKNSSYDYNVGRNHRQTHLLRIKGFNEEDARVEVIEESILTD